MIIDHIGIVVKSIEEGIIHWKKIFRYTPMTEIITNSRQRVRVVFLEKKDSILIKLIQPLDSNSPVYNMAKRGGGIHHLCFKCNDIHTAITDMENNGAKVITQPQPGEAFNNEDIAFIYVKNGLNIELIETDKKAGLLKEKKYE